MTDRSPEQVVADGIYADTWAEPDPNRPEWHHRFARWQANCAARLAIAALRAEGFIVVKVDEAQRNSLADAVAAALTAAWDKQPYVGQAAYDDALTAVGAVLTALGSPVSANEGAASNG